MMAKTNDFRALVVLAALALAGFLLVLVAAEKPAKAAFPGKNGLIAFVTASKTMMERFSNSTMIST